MTAFSHPSGHFLFGVVRSTAGRGAGSSWGCRGVQWLPQGCCWLRRPQRAAEVGTDSHREGGWMGHPALRCPVRCPGHGSSSQGSGQHLGGGLHEQLAHHW